MITRHGICHHVCEWGYHSGKRYNDPFNEVELDVLFSDEAGHTWRVPAYWAGELEWRVRFAPPAAGSYRYRTLCSDEDNADLHGQEGLLEVAPYSGDHPLYAHGPLRVSADGRHLEHADGTPFFWLGDTWWYGLCKRLAFPEDLGELIADRVAKGFTLIQIVAGLYPDAPAFDERGANEAGFPWEPEYARLNPAYFDMADLRIQALVRAGLVPCIVGCWGYHLLWLGMDRMKQHWRNLVARYGAYPVVWCLAGEGAMPYYLSKDKAGDAAALKRGWTEMARYLQALDPYDHPITIHPTNAGRDQVEDDSVLDLDMLQTGHGGYASIPNTVRAVQRAAARTPHMPVVLGEVCYEGILEGSREEIQRFMFWNALLSGVAGFTYGANGIWQVNTEQAPFGPSPHGASWGNRPWREAYRLPGSGQLGVGKRLLERYPWWRFESHPEWVEPHATLEEPVQPYAAGIPGEVRVIYFARPLAPWMAPYHLCALEADVRYRAFFFDPKDAAEYPLGTVTGAASWQVPTAPIIQDWVLVLERQS